MKGKQKLSPEKRREMLDELEDVCREGQAENEPEEEESFLRHFLPIRSHYRILEPDILLMIGDKGAGKSELFRALTYEAGRRALTDMARQLGRNVLDLKQIHWMVGFQTSGTDFPPPLVMRELARKHGPGDMQLFWLALLMRVLLLAKVLPEGRLTGGLHKELFDGSWPLEKWVDNLQQQQGLVFGIMDELDNRMRRDNRYVFVIYDELDRVGAEDWEALQQMLRGLVQLWAIYSRRWRRLRPKLFLRRDLYDRTPSFGPDIAKIAASKAEIVWDVQEFYGVLMKRLLNSGARLRPLLDQALPPHTDAGPLGKLPVVRSAEDYRRAVERLFGPYMGSDPRKGFTFNWIPNHLKDGRGRIYPRPLLRLVAEAARMEIPQLRGQETGALVHHTALRGALDQVSEFRVQELQEEFPWIRTMQAALKKRPFLVPENREEVEAALAKIPWEKGKRPPFKAGRELLEFLFELGITQLRRDGRVDVGDLYLRGLGLKRKGGVARPRSA
ncbi:MAG: hypothetical protein M0031_01045 [Thermaerobacter sp.]|nr:hypothetical protein [Thermaerobacter sp.]